MAIKVIGTTVIDNNRNILNVNSFEVESAFPSINLIDTDSSSGIYSTMVFNQDSYSIQSRYTANGDFIDTDYSIAYSSAGATDGAISHTFRTLGSSRLTIDDTGNVSVLTGDLNINAGNVFSLGSKVETATGNSVFETNASGVGDDSIFRLSFSDETQAEFKYDSSLNAAQFWTTQPDVGLIFGTNSTEAFRITTSQDVTIANNLTINGSINNFRAELYFDNYDTMIADTDLDYAGTGKNLVSAGQIITTRKEGFSYEVLASGATAASGLFITTAGGIKLQPQPIGKTFFPEMIGAKGDAYEGTSVSANTCTDDWQKIQNLVDYATYFINTNPVKTDDRGASAGEFGGGIIISGMPGKCYGLSNTVSFDYGFKHSVMTNMTFRPVGNSSVSASTFWPADRPLIGRDGGNAGYVILQNIQLWCDYACSGITTQSFWQVYKPFIRNMASGGYGIQLKGVKSYIEDPDIIEIPIQESDKFYNDANYGATGILIYGYDHRVFGGEVGWCGKLIEELPFDPTPNTDSGSGGINTLIQGTHLFNGMEPQSKDAAGYFDYNIDGSLIADNPSGTPSTGRSNPIGFESKGDAPIKFSEIYWDNCRIDIYNDKGVIIRNGHFNYQDAFTPESVGAWIWNYASANNVSNRLIVQNASAGVINDAAGAVTGRKLIRWEPDGANTWNFNNVEWENSEQNVLSNRYQVINIGTEEDTFMPYDGWSLTSGSDTAFIKIRDRFMTGVNSNTWVRYGAVGTFNGQALITSPSGDFIVRNQESTPANSMKFGGGGQLEVGPGSSTLSTGIEVLGNSATNTFHTLKSDGDVVFDMFYDVSLSRSFIRTGNTAIDMNIQTDNTTAVYINGDDQNVGIKKSSPTFPLDVEGSIRTTGNMNVEGNVLVSANTPSIKLIEEDGTAAINETVLVTEGDDFRIQSQGTGGFVSNDYVMVRGLNGATEHQWRIENVSPSLVYNSTGLGVGTSPTAALDVAGNAVFSNSGTDTLELIRPNSTSFSGISLSEGTVGSQTIRWLIYGENDAEHDLKIQGRDANGTITSTAFEVINATGDLQTNNKLLIAGGSAAAPSLAFTADTDTGIYRPGSNTLGFVTNGNEVGRFFGNNLLLNTTNNTPGVGNTDTGFSFTGGNALIVSRSANTPVFVNRTGDGQLVSFRESGSEEGSISVSGTTVSYTGGHLARWSRLEGNVRPELYKGTVMSNLDEMIEWEDEENEQLNHTEVSKLERDRNVAGLFVSWDDSDDYDDYLLAMTGDLVVRIAEGVTVQRGDLLESAGDGTARPQDDDLVRGSTIAKVTSTNVSCVYPDGSYAVPCVVMAC